MSRTANFSSDVGGRVRNMKLPKSQPLLPLFEAVINSIQAIQDAGAAKGHISIDVIRDRRSQPISNSETLFSPNITGFIIKDNGIGFNEDNYKSFMTADSTYRAQQGNKGIGRFLWLKAFEIVKIDSIYSHNGAKNRISFDFIDTKPYMASLSDKPYSGDEECGTQITLNLIKSEYSEAMPKSGHVVAKRIVEHLLIYFVNDIAPEITLLDNGECIDLRKIYNEDVLEVTDGKDLDIGNHVFAVKYIKSRGGTETRHAAHLCANTRLVKVEAFEKYLPDLKDKLGTDDPYVLLAYVKSSYLDKHTNQERNRFDFPEESIGDPDLSVILREITNNVKINFKSDIERLRREKFDRIEEFISAEAPQYRPLLHKKYSDLIEKIPPNLNPEKLDIELHKAVSQIELDVKKESEELLRRRGPGNQTIAEFRERYDHILETIGDLGKTNLARHVLHRRMVLDLFEHSISLNEDGVFPLEEQIHKIIHPMNVTSDEVAEEYQNLWLIDEKLAYHSYLTSDRKLNRDDVLEIDSERETDILIYFDRPHAFSESKDTHQSIVLIEFKRPGKSQYRDDRDDPIRQMLNYAEIIREGKARDSGGRFINAQNIPIYGYAVVDFTPNLHSAMKKNGLRRSHDGEKYFGYNEPYQVYLEAISFGALLRDARKRNRILFSKLGIRSE
ncbi:MULTISPECIES: ATP-binding protein [unclassified Deinococcus]|uniref:ATP-binding protein n=1 Tax=unclassified Deinococcus TaxID=2623546 RepID=UPI001C2FD681|nr:MULTISPECIES: ATP-binding protein [unclassified Deinococcus]MDK2013522.1 ATP-binding protein [Deinococcus sp. 43]